jgi:hypothetical protein
MSPFGWDRDESGQIDQSRGGTENPEWQQQAVTFEATQP